MRASHPLRSQLRAPTRLSTRGCLGPSLSQQHPLRLNRRPLIQAVSRSQVVTGRRNAHGLSFLGDTIQGTQDFILNLHTVTGTPWFVTIPLVALGVNAIFRLPFAVYAQKIAQQRVKLTPLLQAWNIRTIKSYNGHSLTEADKMKRITKEHISRTKKLYRDWGLQQWKMHGSFLSLPFWLVAIEAIRRLCGGPKGLLGNLLFGSKKDEAGAEAGVEAATLASSAPTDAVASVDSLPVDSGPLQDVITHGFAAGVEPSLATGGCLWFPNLMEADPYHVLPVALSVMLVLNLMPRTEAGIRSLFGLDQKPGAAESPRAVVPELVQTKAMRGLHRSLLLVASSVGVITMDLPSALHLYWLSSAAFNYAMTSGVRLIMPIPKWSIKPCRNSEPFFIPPKRVEEQKPRT